MPSKIGVLIRCYNITDYLPFVLKNYAWVDKIVVMNYRFTSAEPREDDTEKIVREFEHKEIILDRGEGLEQHQILNRGLRKYLSDCGLVFISDADEFMTQGAMHDITDRMLSDNKNLGNARIIDYAFDFYHRFDNRHLGGALVAVKPQETEFTHIRQTMVSNPKIQFEHILYHFGFVLPHKTLQWKLRWESKEEGIDVVKGIGETPLVLAEPPDIEIMKLLGEV